MEERHGRVGKETTTCGILLAAASYCDAMDFSLQSEPDFVTMWWCIAVALAFFGTAVMVTVRRGRGAARPGAAVAVLLVLSALAAYMAYEAYFPQPRDFWY
jgi:uncharacterized membrane protein YhaH (DUF805 family)